METNEIVVNNLSCKTIQGARAYYLKIGEPAERLTTETVKKFLSGHFDGLLNYHLNDTFDRGDIDFEKEKQELLSKLPEMDEKTKETLVSELWALFATGYLNGYVTGVKDAETFLNAINEAERTET